MAEIRSRIAALGSAFPAQVLTNFDLEKIVDTSDQWISERTGIKERRKLSDNEQNSDIAAAATLDALKKAGVSPSEVDLIIGCTTSPDSSSQLPRGTIRTVRGSTGIDTSVERAASRIALRSVSSLAT